MGHLGKARSRLSEDETLLKKQKEMQATAVERTKEESERIRTELKAGREKEKHAALKAKAELVLEQRKTELALDAARFKAHWGRFTGFIRTATEPALYYLPAKMSEPTVALLSKCAREIEEKVAAKVKEQEEAVAELEEAFRLKWEQSEAEAEPEVEEDDGGAGSANGEKDKGKKKEKEAEEEEEQEAAADDHEAKAPKGDEAADEGAAAAAAAADNPPASGGEKKGGKGEGKAKAKGKRKTGEEEEEEAEAAAAAPAEEEEEEAPAKRAKRTPARRMTPAKKGS